VAGDIGRVVRFDNTSGAVKIYTELSDLPDLNLTAAVQDASGDVWFGSTDGYLVKLHPQTETFTPYNALTATGCSIICMRRFADYLLVGTNKGLGVFSVRDKIFQNVKKFNSFSSVDVSAIHVFGDTIAIATGDGIAYSVISNIQTTTFSDPGIWTTIPEPNVLALSAGQARSRPARIKSSSSATIPCGNSAGRTPPTPPCGQSAFFNDLTVYNFPSPVTCVLPLGNSRYAVGTENSYWYQCNLSAASFGQGSDKTDLPLRTSHRAPLTRTACCGLFQTIWQMGSAPTTGKHGCINPRQYTRHRHAEYRS